MHFLVRRLGIRPLLGIFLVASVLLSGCQGGDLEGGSDLPAVGVVAEFGIVVHGGAGTITRSGMTDEMEAAFHASLEAALEAGYAVLDRGGSALDAVVEAVRMLEDDALFNAGRGAVFTSEGTNELDAAIMDGATLNAGAVAGVTRVKNPIALARLVMEESPHVFMMGVGAETFGSQFNIETEDSSWFYTDRRWEALERARERERVTLGFDMGENRMMGTVGAVARDQNGNLAAASSTGGMTNKRFGRVGSVPVIGAGTYASNESCAVSATGHGEYYIRNVVAREICARMEYLGETLQEASDAIVMVRLLEQGGEGGIIAIDRNGHISMTMNSAGMYRGHYLAGGRPFTAIYADEGSGPR